MYGTRSDVGTPGRLPGAEVATAPADPAWRPWIRLLDTAFAAAGEPGWLCDVPAPQVGRTSNAPLLHGVTLRINARRTRSLVRELIRVAERDASEREPAEAVPAERDGARRSRRRASLDVSAIVEAAIVQDDGSMEQIAQARMIRANLLATVAQLATLPILSACAAQFRSVIPETWMHGYCPVCAAWPAMAEMRGLERNRRLRCGRCGTDWPLPVLTCAFCGELHHDHLYALVPDEHEKTRRVDVCDTCKGYLKTVSTLQPMALRLLAMMDLETVALDVVAQERGYTRPDGPGFPLSVRVVNATARGVSTTA